VEFGLEISSSRTYTTIVCHAARVKGYE